MGLPGFAIMYSVTKCPRTIRTVSIIFFAKLLISNYHGTGISGSPNVRIVDVMKKRI